jgi:SRSO17 transposase
VVSLRIVLDHEQLNQRRVQLSREDPATAPHDAGVLVIDDTRDRKDDTATAHVARQNLGSLGSIRMVITGGLSSRRTGTIPRRAA